MLALLPFHVSARTHERIFLSQWNIFSSLRYSGEKEKEIICAAAAVFRAIPLSDLDFTFHDSLIHSSKETFFALCSPDALRLSAFNRKGHSHDCREFTLACRPRRLCIV